MKLVEEYAGVGDLSGQGEVLRQVRYKIARYQAVAGNGLPIPGRIASRERSTFRRMRTSRA